MRFFLNPFLLFFCVFSSSFFLYEMNLSLLYRGVESSPLKVVVFLFIIFSVFFGWLYHYFFIKKLRCEDSSYITKSNSRLIIFFIAIGAAIEFIYARQIPFITVIRGMGYEYKDFGIPTFHVFLVVYIMTASTLSFNRYMRHGDKYNVFVTVTCIIYSVLIVNRGMMLMLISPCVYLYLYYKGSKKSLLYTLFFLLFVIIAFGYIGDKRMKASGYTDDNPIYRIGQIDSDVLKLLPSGFSWFYIYTSSPIANLLNQPDKIGVAKGDIIDFSVITVIPDFLSKRIYTKANPVFDTVLIDPQLTVSTGFGPAFRIYGYLGVLLTYLYLFIIIIIFSFINKRKNVIPTLSILCSISALMVFSNMLNFSAAILPLLFITLFSNLVFKFGEYRFRII